MKASIIIRTKNEERWLGEVLKQLAGQTEKDFEVIIVDSGSSDKTLKIAACFVKRLDIKIYKVRQSKFTYPYACNFGARKAKGNFLIFLSGHSVPISKNWLTDGLSDFENKKVAGVYGNVYPLPNASIWERAFYLAASLVKAKKKIETKPRMGILGNTNAIIRKDLWQKHNFDENYKDGGEDGEWAKHFLDQGYIIIREPNFSVYHSHHLGLIKFIKQYIHWRKLASKFLARTPNI